MKTKKLKNGIYAVESEDLIHQKNADIVKIINVKEVSSYDLACILEETDDKSIVIRRGDFLIIS